jgi:hypothetical protein
MLLSTQNTEKYSYKGKDSYKETQCCYYLVDYFEP